MNTLSRYYHTVRHLKPVQIVGRLAFALRTPAPDVSAPPRARRLTDRYVTPIPPEPSMIGPATFTFLNVKRTCSEPGDWRSPDVAKLWLYNLHYFDDLCAQLASERTAWHRQLLSRWVAENPPALSPGWEPYPLSRRIVNWVKWALSGNRLPPECHESLAVQARWLMHRLEYHILGNHLLANAKALIHAALYFEGREADRWYATGMGILRRQLPEQVLPDGGHFELSTMYHAMVLEDVLDLVNLLRSAGRQPPSEWEPYVGRMQRWLQIMTHPDGDIAFFNDSAFDLAPKSAELAAYADTLGLPAMAAEPASLVALESSGYVRAAHGAASVFCDCARVGPDHLPGHGHADTLSFELSLAKRRVFVNSGTSEYGTSAERQRQRGTAAHNTVVVDGRDSTVVWGGFRVAQRAVSRLHAAVADGRCSFVEASHDGYGPTRHRRSWRLCDDSLDIRDALSGTFTAADAYFHLHPDVQARQGPGGIELDLPGTSIRLAFDGARDAALLDGTWHPRFGVTTANTCIVVRFAGPELKTKITWTIG